MKIVTTESLPILADNKTSITRGSAANSQGAKFESPIVLAFANLTIEQSLIWEFPGLEKSWILGKMAEVMEKSWY